jgi:hypothetical protein
MQQPTKPKRRSVGVVVGFVLGQHTHRVPGIDDEHPVKDFPPRALRDVLVRNISKRVSHVVSLFVFASLPLLWAELLGYFARVGGVSPPFRNATAGPSQQRGPDVFELVRV